MNKSQLFVLGIFFAAINPVLAQTEYSLVNIIEKAKSESPSFKQAETRKENRYWQYKLFKSNYNPQLAVFGAVPNYNRDYLSNRQDDGSIKFQNRQQVNSFINLGLEQPLALTGGSISVNTNMNHFKDLNSELTRWNSTLVNFQVNQPLFGYNRLKWDKKTEPLRYEESKREYVEEMEFISRRAVNLFFNYLDAQINLQIAEFNLANNDTIFNIQQGRYNIGTSAKDELLQVELQLLTSQYDVTKANLDLQMARLGLNAFIGKSGNEEFSLQFPKGIPDLSVSEEDALKYAKANRADFVAFERRRIEAESQIAKAKSERFKTDVVASFGLNSAGNNFDGAYQDPLNQQRLNLQLNIPVLTWGQKSGSA